MLNSKVSIVAYLNWKITIIMTKTKYYLINLKIIQNSGIRELMSLVLYVRLFKHT